MKSDQDPESESNPIQYLPDIPKEIQDLLLKGRKIEAIKIMREKTGMGLAESKVEIEKIQAQMKEAFPDRFKSLGNSGCAACLLILFLIPVLFFMANRM